MARKERIVIRREDNLKDIDDELDEAMSRLDGANDRIANLLQAVDKNIPLEIPENIVADWHDETATPVRAGHDAADEEE